MAKEIVAKENLETEFGKASILKDLGFIVCIRYPWLGCSPDAIVIDNGEFVLIECKSLKLGKTYAGLQFLRKCKFLIETTPSHFVLKKTNSYFTQIQLGLYICNLTRGKLLLYNHKIKKNLYVDVHRDDEHIRDLLLGLTRTYFTHCFKYLYDKRDNLIKM